MTKRIAILGLGLIGSSLARALAQSGNFIAAFDISPTALDYAAAQGFVSSRHTDARECVANADIIVLASPPSTFSALAHHIASSLKQGAILTDVASVKRSAIASISAYLPSHAHYVPGHPIAGSEHSGVAAGRDDLFAGKQVILTPAESELLSEPVACIAALWESTGAKIEYMPADLHDLIYAYVSHLPQLAAFAARSLMENLPASHNESTRRFMRLMQSGPSLWADICLANADYIAKALEDFTLFISQMAGELSEASDKDSEDSTPLADIFSYIIASNLIATASTLQESTGVYPTHYAGSGFADMTAAAMRNPEIMLAAISARPQATAKILFAFIDKLSVMRAHITQKDREGLIKIMSIIK